MKPTIFRLCLLLFLCSNTFSQTKHESIENLVYDFHKKQKFDGVILVAKNEKIIYENALGLANREWNIPHIVDGRFVIGSLSKQFIAALTLILAQEGKLDLNKAIGRYLPELPNDSIANNVTVHHLLSNTSGLHHYSAWDDFLDNKDRLVYSKKDLLKLYENLSLEFTPGTKYKYSSLGYLLIGFILENVSKTDLPSLLNQKIFIPSKMTNSLLPVRDEIIPTRVNSYRYNYKKAMYDNANYRDPSTTFSAGGIISTAKDLYKWLRVLNKNTLLKEQSKTLLYTPVHNNYAYGWRTTFRGINESVHWHSGQSTGYTSVIAKFPDTGHCIIILSNIRDMAYRDLVIQISNILFERKVTYPKKSLLKKLLKETVNKDVKQAISTYYKLKANSKNEYSFSERELLVLAIEMRSEGMYKEALEILFLNLKEYEDQSRFHLTNLFLIARTYEDLEKFDKAKEFYNKVLKIKPNHKGAIDRIEGLKKLKKAN